MATDVEEARLVPTGPPWYSKMFECVKNRNRIGPGKVELPDCDFFNVGPRRTLRILLPTPKASPYYEPMANERPETIDENFVSKWAMRPHPSGNCRCSFRRSERASTNEERIISAELNRIRTSLCEAEKTGSDMDDVEQRISVNLEGLCVDNDDELRKIGNGGSATIGNNNGVDDAAVKNKIVKDLEKYIEDLLQEVLNDTMKLLGDGGDATRQTRQLRDNVNDFSCDELEPVSESKVCRVEEENFVDGTNSLNIKFAFHDDNAKKDTEMKVMAFENGDDGGYVNRGYDGSKTDPDSLDFDLRKPINLEIGMDNLDCIDSGINSVETIEFQTSQEPSLEESLMKIIDAKLGRAPVKLSWEDLRNDDKIESKEDSAKTIVENVENIERSEIPPAIVETKMAAACDKMADATTNHETKETKVEVRKIVHETENNNSKEDNPGKSSNDLEDVEDAPNFDKLRLELIGNENDNKKGAIANFREKFGWKFSKNREDRTNSKILKIANVPSNPVELRIKRDIVWTNRENPGISINDNHADFVKFRKSKKPAIVFLHGFGSSAEIFDHQLEYFSNLGYPCIAPEMLGHGMSSAPDCSRDYHFDKLLKDLEMILQHYAFRPGRKCVLVAHNYGCSFATALAYKYDTKIHQLVLISGGGPTPLAPPSSEGAGHCCLRAVLTPLLMCGLHRDILYSARGRQHPYCGSEPVEQWPSHMKYVLDGMVWPEGDYVFHRRITTPTLLVHGLRDNKVSLVQECQMERTIIKAFLDAIPTAGHTPMTDCPEQVNHMIHCFIDLWRRKKR